MGIVRLASAGAIPLAAFAAAHVAAASAPGCPPDVAAAHLHHYGPAARADVDGDGVADRAWLSAQTSAPASCGILLAVRTRRGLSVARVPGSVAGTAGDSLAHGLPRLFGLLRLGSGRDLEPVVIVARGAQALSFAAFRISGGRLARVSVPGGRSLQWAVGLSAFGSVDCIGSAEGTLLHEAFAERRSNGGWLLTRHTYRLTDSTLQAEKALASVVTKRPALPTGLPFARCRGVRAGG